MTAPHATLRPETPAGGGTPDTPPPAAIRAGAGGWATTRKAEHGTRSRYTLGCRCEPCATANSAYSADYRQRMQDMPFRMVPHGTLHGYDTFGCRCDQCVAAKQTANQRRRKPAVEQVPDGHKRCSRCKEIKPHEDFYTEKRVPDGRRPECKKCHLTDRRDAYWQRKAAVG